MGMIACVEPVGKEVTLASRHKHADITLSQWRTMASDQGAEAGALQISQIDQVHQWIM